MTAVAHSWDLTATEARALQIEMAGRVLRRDETAEVEWIAGTDVHFPSKEVGRAAAVLVRYPDFELVASEVVEERVSFPYVPGLLSFREAPAVMKVLQRLPQQPDLLLVDGQGIAHPRRFGVASHLGVLTGLATVGCAKSRLCGEAGAPAQEAGEWAPLTDGDEVIGAVLRSRARVKPLFVSIGHKVDLPAAIGWVLRCCRGYRVPEPLRLAHQLAGKEMRK